MSFHKNIRIFHWIACILSASYISPTSISEKCTNMQCLEALSKATKGSTASVWRSDAIGTLRLYSFIFEVNPTEMEKWKIVKLGQCEKSIKTKYFNTFDKYIKFVEGKSSIRGNKDIDTGFLDQPKYHNFTTAPPYKLSGKYLDKIQYFLDGGSIATSIGECLVYDIQVKNLNNLPNFSSSFVESFKKLYRASSKSQREQNRVFKNFRQSFGDYFFARVQIGMQFSYSRSVKSKSASVSRKVIKSCNHKTLASNINIQPAKKYKNVKCTSHVKKSLGDTTYRVNGGTFHNMKSMVNKDIRGNPVRYTLLPIFKLINDHIFKQNNITGDGGTVVSSDVIKNWLMPLYYDKLKDYTVKDECPKGYKLFGNWEKHYCEDWSAWRCDVNCGKGKWKSRKRSCHGCLGKTWDIKREKCLAKRNCSKTSKDASIFDTFFPAYI